VRPELTIDFVQNYLDYYGEKQAYVDTLPFGSWSTDDDRVNFDLLPDYLNEYAEYAYGYKYTVEGGRCVFNCNHNARAWVCSVRLQSSLIAFYATNMSPWARRARIYHKMRTVVATYEHQFNVSTFDVNACW
jgi:hypothetical protein